MGIQLNSAICPIVTRVVVARVTDGTVFRYPPSLAQTVEGSILLSNAVSTIHAWAFCTWVGSFTMLANKVYCTVTFKQAMIAFRAGSTIEARY